MNQTSRRPQRRRPRRSPLPLIILLILLFGLCLTAFSCNRTGAAVDTAYAALIGADSNAAALESLGQAYAAQDKVRLRNGIAGDYGAVIKNSEQMNSTLEQIINTQKQLNASRDKKAAEFKKAAKWLFGWTARNKAANEISAACDEITRRQPKALASRQKVNALMRERNDLYIKYSNDEIYSDEFTEMKADIDARLEPANKELAKESNAIDGQIQLMLAKSAAFGI